MRQLGSKFQRRGRFHLGQLKTVDSLLAQAQEAQHRGSVEQERIMLEAALALSGNDPMIRKTLAKHHLRRALAGINHDLAAPNGARAPDLGVTRRSRP